MSGIADSNRGPRRPERRALPTELIPELSSVLAPRSSSEAGLPIHYTPEIKIIIHNLIESLILDT